MLILGIETSCDETAVALVKDGKKVLVNLIASQIPIHAQYGGVVPELASRNHLLKINLLIKQAMKEGGVDFSDLDGIAVTKAPGLVGSLLVGVSTAKAIAYVHQKPLIGVNHPEGHLYANFIKNPQIAFPFLGMVISGGHTSLIRVTDHHRYRILGQTRDDAIGEAFDKIAKLLKLGYPGGPVIEKLALKGDENRYKLPKSRFKSGCQLDFSFSGLKTAVLTITKKETDFNHADLVASFQKTASEYLLEKIAAALEKENLDTLVVGGGVIANKYIRDKLQKLMTARNGQVFYPSMVYCTDNAAMIAILGYYRLKAGEISDLSLNASANLPLAEGSA